MAIQLIITKEYGIFKNQNPLQGSSIIENLTGLVEEAVLQEFEALNRRGGVLGAMESYYQRGKIQDESLYYELKKIHRRISHHRDQHLCQPEYLAENYSRPPPP